MSVSTVSFLEFGTGSPLDVSVLGVAESRATARIPCDGRGRVRECSKARLSTTVLSTTVVPGMIREVLLSTSNEISIRYSEVNFHVISYLASTETSF